MLIKKKLQQDNFYSLYSRMWQGSQANVCSRQRSWFGFQSTELLSQVFPLGFDWHRAGTLQVSSFWFWMQSNDTL